MADMDRLFDKIDNLWGAVSELRKDQAVQKHELQDIRQDLRGLSEKISNNKPAGTSPRVKVSIIGFLGVITVETCAILALYLKP